MRRAPVPGSIAVLYVLTCFFHALWQGSGLLAMGLLTPSFGVMQNLTLRPRSGVLTDLCRSGKLTRPCLAKLTHCLEKE